MTQDSFVRPRLLVVEDEKVLIDLYVSLLEAEGYIVDRAEDGESALIKITENVFDLILLDIILPKMDGLTVLKNLKKIGKLPKGAIVLLTNLGQDLVMAEAIQYEVRGYIIKNDYTPDQLLKEIRGYVYGAKTS